MYGLRGWLDVMASHSLRTWYRYFHVIYLFTGVAGNPTTRNSIRVRREISLGNNETNWGSTPQTVGEVAALKPQLAAKPTREVAHFYEQAWILSKLGEG
jgi:hypothetical protein